MIRPISGVNFSNNYSKRTSFKAFYDPTCPNIPATMKTPTKDALGHFLDAAKDRIAELTKTADSATIIHAESQTVTHILPSGTPYTFNTKNLSEDAEIPTEAPASHKFLDGNNILDIDHNKIYHIMPSGNSYDIPVPVETLKVNSDSAGLGNDFPIDIPDDLGL